jgi:hypothetical protein
MNPSFDMKKFEETNFTVTKSMILSSLFELFNDRYQSGLTQRPLIVIFNDNLDWLKKNEACAARFLHQLQQYHPSSPNALQHPVFYLQIESPNDMKPVHTTTNNRGSNSQANQSPPSMNSNNNNNNQQGSSSQPFGLAGFLTGPSSYASLNKNPSHQQQQQQQQSPQQQQIQAPPSSQPQHPQQQFFVTSRAFQVVVQNGTTKMIPLPSPPPGMLPPSFLSPHMMSNSHPMMPPPEILKKMMAERHNQTDSNRELPEGWDEDMKDFLEDPDNQVMLKVNLFSRIKLRYFFVIIYLLYEYNI